MTTTMTERLLSTLTRASPLPELLLLGAAAGLDAVTGMELRVSPMYFVPVALSAWTRGRGWATVVALLCASSWSLSNRFPALLQAKPHVWGFNVFLQLAAFLLVGLVISAIHTRAKAERALARTDALTGLLNARAFEERARLELERAKRHARPLTVMYVDLDNFKDVNDCFGHAEGDNLLREVAEALRLSSRSTDAVARLGGDEFAAVLSELPPEKSRIALERIQQALRERLRNTRRPVTASIGALCFQSAPSDVAGLLGRADGLMYEAKRSGKDRLHFEVSPSGSEAEPAAPSPA